MFNKCFLKFQEEGEFCNKDNSTYQKWMIDRIFLQKQSKANPLSHSLYSAYRGNTNVYSVINNVIYLNKLT